MSKYLEIADQALRETGNTYNEINEINEKRWNPEMASQGYVWCLDCKHWSGGTIDDPGTEIVCTHMDNPFRKQQPLAPRKCHWYTDRN